MALLASLFGVNATSPWSANDDRWFTDNLGARSNAGRWVTPELALRVSAVYCSVNLLSRMLASIPLRMYQTDKDGAVTEAPNHPLNDVLEYQPNSWQTAWDFRAMLMSHLCLRGNGYAEIIPGPRGFADSLEPIHPDRITKVERLPDGTLRYRLMMPNGGQKWLLQSEIMHLRSAIATNGFVGVGPITYARETIGLALAAEEHGARTFSNGARPSGVVEVKRAMGDEAFERFKTDFSSIYSGLGNVGKTPILEEGATFKPIAMTAEDSQFLGSRQFQIEEIARWFDVPLVMLHHMTNQTSWGTGVEAIMLAFVRNNLMPWLTCWTQAIRRDLILAPNIYSAQFDVDQLIAGDSKTKSFFYTSLCNAGILTRNEGREALGYNTLPGLDAPLISNKLQHSDNVAQPSDPNNPNDPSNPNAARALLLGLLGHNGGPVLDDASQSSET